VTNFPSAATSTPTVPYDDAGSQMAVALQFNLTANSPVSGARWFATSGGAGVSVYAVLGTWVDSGGGTFSLSSTLATSESVVSVDGWVDIPFPAPVDLVTGVNYVVVVVQPNSQKYTATPGVFPQTLAPFTQGDATSGGWVYGDENSALNWSSTWYGLDIVSGTTIGGGQFFTDALPIADSVTVQREGLPTSVSLTASATDTLGASTSVSATDSVGDPVVALDRVTRYMQRDRVNFQSPVDSERDGPNLYVDTSEVGVRFYVERPCTLTGARIFKHPAATGSIPVTLWNYDTQAALATTTLTWTADDGGWREFDLPDVNLVTGINYALSYHTNAYGVTNWRFNGQDFYEWPFFVPGGVTDNGDNTFRGGGCYSKTGAAGFPDGSNTAAWYWIDPRVEWDSPIETYKGGREYFDQWPNANMDDFPIGIFAVDGGGGYFQEYKDIGANSLIPWNALNDRDEIVAAGVGFFATNWQAPGIISDPPLAALCKGYVYWDEPDMQGSGGTADDLRREFVWTRQRDSSRPCYFGFGNQMIRGQAFAWFPNGASSQYVSGMWREQATLTDMLSGDDYVAGDSPDKIWQYAVQMDRFRNFTDNRVPVFATLDACIQVGGVHDITIDEMKRAAMLCIVHGARGIMWFDHQFYWAAPDGTVYPQDFQRILHDPVKKAGCTTFHAFLQTIKDALWAPEAGLLADPVLSGGWVSVPSSNRTSGPIGGELGVPIHATSRVAGTSNFIIASAARPGTTTGTFVAPSAAGKTITVLDEGRTITADGSGQFTDEFASDYVYHVYQWTP
jgi:hypothetical protein